MTKKKIIFIIRMIILVIWCFLIYKEAGLFTGIFAVMVGIVFEVLACAFEKISKAQNKISDDLDFLIRGMKQVNKEK